MTSFHSCVAVVALWLFSRWRTEIKKYVGEVFVCPALRVVTYNTTLCKLDVYSLDTASESLAYMAFSKLDSHRCSHSRCSLTEGSEEDV